MGKEQRLVMKYYYYGVEFHNSLLFSFAFLITVKLSNRIIYFEGFQISQDSFLSLTFILYLNIIFVL